MADISPDDLPQEGDILEGTIARIEAYGAFCRLDTGGSNNRRRPPQGLIHISQLVPDQRVERVDDVLSVEDRVWVKVLKVEMDSSTQRWRIQLSRKDVSQDGLATDLGLERQTREQQRNQMESSLNSMIGMGVALDPMADRLTMKHSANGRQAGTTTTFRGGYSLVGDDEGEPEPEDLPVVEAPTKVLAPIGRGRGSTLPAWMTQASEGPTGRQDDDSDGDDDGAQKHHKKHKRKHSKPHRKHHKKRSSSTNMDRKDRKKRSHRRDRDNSDPGSESDQNRSLDSSSGDGDQQKRRKKNQKERPSSPVSRGKEKRKKRRKDDRRSRHKFEESDSTRSEESSRRRKRSRSRGRHD